METRRKGGKGVVLGLVILMFLGVAAQGELITIAIEATVDYVNDEGNYLEGKVNVGDIITGYYIYESTTPDSYPTDNNRGRYEHSQSPCGIFLTVGGIDFQTDLSDVVFEIWAINNYYSNDSYSVISDNNISSNGIYPDSIKWQLGDNSEMALQNDGLPTTAPVLSQWGENDLSIYSSRNYLIRSTVTSAEVIPEPMTIILLLSGSLFLCKKS